MVRDENHLIELSEQYDIKVEDVLLIAINACGLSNSQSSRRMRFEFAPAGREDDPHQIIPSFERGRSPFHFEGGSLYLRDRPVGSLRNLKADDIVMGYWRNGRKNLTLNSNARSACVGCMFCYTHLDPASDPRISQAEELDSYLRFLKDDLRWESLSPIEKISVCSGCFLNEKAALTHMELVRDIAAQHGFAGELHLLSSVIRSRRALEYISRNLRPFHLTLTIECFERRHEFLKRSKADLDFDEMLRIFEDAGELGVKIDFTYIVGLDSPEHALPKLAALAKRASAFPRFQIYQSHNDFQELCRTRGSDRLEFFLDARRDIEAVFAPLAPRPQSWENYRPLWYYSYGGEPYHTCRI